MKTILATKKLSPTIKQKLIESNFIVIDKNFIKIKNTDFLVKTLHDFVIFTSKNAVKSVLKSKIENQIKYKKVFCVGKKTKKFLEKNHFIVQECEAYAKDLGLLIQDYYKYHSFTFFSGNIRKDDLPNILNENNIEWNEVEVYETALNPKKIEEALDGILFFSPSGVASYLQKNKIENETCFCIGNTTAKALENKTKNIKIALKPSVENVIDEVKAYYQS